MARLYSCWVGGGGGVGEVGLILVNRPLSAFFPHHYVAVLTPNDNIFFSMWIIIASNPPITRATFKKGVATHSDPTKVPAQRHDLYDSKSKSDRRYSVRKDIRRLYPVHLYDIVTSNFRSVFIDIVDIKLTSASSSLT